jgi:hypothetical protein
VLLAATEVVAGGPTANSYAVLLQLLMRSKLHIAGGNAATSNIGSLDAIIVAGCPHICAAVAAHTRTGSTASFEPCMHSRETDMTKQ